jgi:peptidoglycan/LPS O-acetylase OafA/YrhL
VGAGDPSEGVGDMQLELRPATSPPTNKLLGLEVLRFLTALAILIYHYPQFSFIADKPVDLASSHLPFHGWLHIVYEVGPYGVWIFWCISGFIFFWKYRDAITGRAMGGRTFLVLRLSRLYPLHLVTLLLVAVLQPIYFNLHGSFFVYQENDLRHFVLQLFMASNWGLQNAASFNGPIWSISVEVLVYAFFFLTLLVTRSWLVNLAVIAACLSGSGQIPVCFAFFYIGGLAAIARRSVSTMQWGLIVEGATWLAFVSFALLAWSYTPARLGLFDFQFLLIMTPIALFCLARDFHVAAPIQRSIEAAGNMTYSSYLLHFPIQLMIVLGFATIGGPIPLYDARFFAAFLVVTLLASYFTYRYFEAPAQHFIREWLLRRSMAPSQQALGLMK